MKKNTIKAFTLVEMLIVIVIIGILIASLMPRMQAAQWRARDVARKNDLAQIQTAIISSQSDRREWPSLTGAKQGMAINDDIKQTLLDAWMSSVPVDPNGSNKFTGLWNLSGDDSQWKYGYMVTKRNGIDDWWFVLMAKTETEWWSNWVVCSGATSSAGLSQWFIKEGEDLKGITTCQTLRKKTASDGSWCTANTQDCIYEETAELRYILLY